MDTDLAPIDVATHWPFLERMLLLERWESGRRAGAMLAQLQVDSGGDPVSMGRTRIAGSDLTAGEAGSVWRSLVELERRGVTARFRGRGRRPDAWTFRSDIAHWREMPWRFSGPGAEKAIDGCFCRAANAVAARNPGQRVALPRVKEVFRISPHEHLFRPGLLPVDSRGFGEVRAATAISPAWDPVDTRGNGAKIEPIRASVNSVEELKVLHWQSEEHQEVVALIQKAIERHTRQRYNTPTCKPRLHLIELCRHLTVGQAREAVRLIERTEEFVQIPWAHKVFLPEILSSPEVKGAARSGWSQDLVGFDALEG